MNKKTGEGCSPVAHAGALEDINNSGEHKTPAV